ncbi:BPIB3 protein, partial [Chauna torquata]|nr:BPIB3 protein [Chauna torquata]
PKMCKFWAVFLLCGLLTSSQGFVGSASVSARVDKDVLENAITGSLTNGNPLEGLLGGLLGGSGLGGLLGSDGLVGGLLGDNGLADGLLGGDGLVGGILGNNGLVGIVNITLPKINLRFLPGIGLQLNIYTQLLIDGNGAVGGLLQLQVEANITARARLVQDKSGALKLVVEDCKTLLGGINIPAHLCHVLFPIFLLPRPKVPLVEKTLKSVLGNVLPRLLCPVVDTILGVMNSLLGSMTSVLPLGALGDLQFTLSSLPIVSDKSIQLDLNLLLRDAEGNVVEPVQGQLSPVTLLPAAGNGVQLGLSQGVLGAVLGLAQRQGAFNLDISSSAVPNSISLSTSALLSVFPQLAAVLPGSLPLALRVRLSGTPEVALQDGRATATFRATVDVLAHRPGFPLQTLFTLDSDIDLNITPSVSSGKLRTSLAIESVHPTPSLFSSGIDSCLLPLQVSRLEGWVKDVLAAAYVPAINSAMSMGIPLPNILNASFENGQVDVADVRRTLFPAL